MPPSEMRSNVVESPEAIEYLTWTQRFGLKSLCIYSVLEDQDAANSKTLNINPKSEHVGGASAGGSGAPGRGAADLRRRTTRQVTFLQFPQIYIVYFLKLNYILLLFF